MRVVLAGIALLSGCIFCSCNQERLPRINTVERVPATQPGSSHATRSHGVVRFTLSSARPAQTFWNDPDTKKDPWGTIRLLRVDADQTVHVELGKEELRAKPGRVFPGTGFRVRSVDVREQSAVLESEWSHTRIEE